MKIALPRGWTRRDVLALALVRAVHSADLRYAVEQCASLEQALETPPQSLQKLLQQELFDQRNAEVLRQRADEHLEQLTRIGARMCTYWDEDYPALLRQISFPPIVLYVWGALQPADALAIAIVGTRRCTQYGKLCAERFAEGFVRAGCVVVSGLAAGIDSIAHQAALNAGGITYAVIASGLDCLQPSYARRLAQRIVESSGAVLSEYPLGTVARPGYFPQRNRIISGIARAVLVVESRREGGSLITAHFALDQGRDLFAVPGNLTAATSEGTNLLIAQQKAQLAFSPEHMLSELGITVTQPKPSSVELLSPLEEQLWQALSSGVRSADDLAAELSTPVGEVLGALLLMEFRGLVRQLPGKQFVRVES